MKEWIFSTLLIGFLAYLSLSWELGFAQSNLEPYSKIIALPKPTGPYSVGTKALELKDSSRKMLRDPNERRWMVQAFYPSNPSPSAQNFYKPETLKKGMLKGFRILANASLNAPIPSHFPVIFFIPGFGETRQNYTILCEELASHGYVVLSLDQPYVSNFVKFKEDSVIVPTFKDVWNTPRDRDYRYRYFDEAMTACIQDIGYMLGHLKELQLPLDPKNIVLMGHSFGGNVAHTLGFKDARIKTIVDLDSKITEREIYGHVGVPLNIFQKPILFIRSNQYQEDVQNHLTKAPKATLKVFNVQHSAFQDTVYLKSFGLQGDGSFLKLWKWFFKTGPIFDTIDTELNGQDPREWYQRLTKKILRFLDQNLSKKRPV